LPTAIVLHLIVWIIGQVLLLCAAAAFLCLSDRLMLLLYAALCTCHCASCL